jgi:predicted nicotinamide N-methyase
MTTDRAGLLDGLPLITRVVPVGGRVGDLAITAVEDQTALVAAAARFVEVPFGLVLWDSAVAMAMAVGQGAIEVRGRAVLEIGCGVGLAGIAAARAGARVAQSDHEPAALELAAINAAANGVTTQRHLSDWRRPDVPDAARRPGLILGADVLYDHAMFEALANLFAATLAPAGVIWLADPMRPHTQTFLDAMAAQGWSIQTQRAAAVTGGHGVRPVALIKLLRQGSIG